MSPSTKTVSLAAAATLVAAGPCDIYASGNTPCVAAHSTTRALYSSFSGALYEISRTSDNSTANISPLSAGGIANAAAQDSFCSGTTCLITTIYDQSGNGNHLTQAPPGHYTQGPDPGGYDALANAAGAPVNLNGNRAYGVFIPPGVGYRNDDTTNIATGDEAEGLYAVLDGTNYNDRCCFDYGNAETDNTAGADGSMEAIYFGNDTEWSTGAGNGPWIMADMENGLFSGYSAQNNQGDPSQSARFLTAMLKGGANQWSLRGGDATNGNLSTYYTGQRPNGYSTMVKQGAIVLGIGGDNGNEAQSTFYEGVMTSGYPSNAIENAVQANIVAARYSVA